jgi:hypothetical protein
MTTDDKKACPAPNNAVVGKKEIAGKKDDGLSKGKNADRSQVESGEQVANSPSSYSRGEGQKAVTKAYRDNWNAIFADKKKKK